MLTFNINRFTLNRGALVAEASDLEMPPGRYPTFIAVRQEDGTAVDYTFERIDSLEIAHYRAITPGNYVPIQILND